MEEYIKKLLSKLKAKVCNTTERSEEIFWCPANCAKGLIVLQYTSTCREEVSFQSNGVKNHKYFAKALLEK